MKKELGDLVLKYFDGNVGLKTVPFVVKFRFGDSIIAFPVRDWKREKLFPVPCLHEKTFSATPTYYF